MVVVGLLIGALAGVIWKDNRPIGVRGDYIAAVIAAVETGLLRLVCDSRDGFQRYSEVHRHCD